jgi:hypothetical protein
MHTFARLILGPLSGVFLQITQNHGQQYQLAQLIESAFLDGQIDGFALDLAHIFLINHARQPSAQLPH